MPDSLNHLADQAQPSGEPAAQGEQPSQPAETQVSGADQPAAKQPSTPDPPPSTPFGEIPVGKTQKQKVVMPDGTTKDITVRVINPHTESKHAT
jgi:hypothetical protein